MGRGGKVRSLGSLGAVAAIVAVGCITEPPAPPSAKVEATLEWNLSANRPQVLRAIRIDARPGNEELASLEWGIGFRVPGGDPWTPPDLWLSVIDTSTGGMPDGLGAANAGPFGSVVPGSCPLDGCIRTLLVLSRWLSPDAQNALSVTADTTLVAYARDAPGRADPSFALERLDIEEEPTLRSDGPFEVRSAHVAAHEALKTGAGPVRRTFVLHASHAAVASARTASVVGRLRFWSTTSSTSHKAARGDGVVELADGRKIWSDGYGGYELDWLPHCPADGACDIPLTMTWAFLMTPRPATDPPDGLLELDWSLDARLEALDGTELPAEAISLEAT